MALPVYSLGVFDFVTFRNVNSWSGAPSLPSQQVQIVQRFNVPGTGFIRGGRSGTPFLMHSFVDLASDVDAAALIANYHLAKGSDPLAIIWRDIDYFGLYGVKFVVVDLPFVGSKRFLGGTGGLNPPSLSSVEALWALVAVEVQR